MLNKLVKTPARADVIQISKPIKVKETKDKIKERYIVFCGQKIMLGCFNRALVYGDLPDFIDYGFFFGKDKVFAECRTIDNLDYVVLYKGVG